LQRFDKCVIINATVKAEKNGVSVREMRFPDRGGGFFRPCCVAAWFLRIIIRFAEGQGFVGVSVN